VYVVAQAWRGQRIDAALSAYHYCVKSAEVEKLATIGAAWILEG
jgi:hypothetical protein